MILMCLPTEVNPSPSHKKVVAAFYRRAPKHRAQNALADIISHQQSSVEQKEAGIPAPIQARSASNPQSAFLKQRHSQRTDALAQVGNRLTPVTATIPSGLVLPAVRRDSHEVQREVKCWARAIYAAEQPYVQSGCSPTDVRSAYFFEIWPGVIVWCTLDSTPALSISSALVTPILRYPIAVFGSG
jgi:hypothetical protein